jgi:hypothetical protein
VCVDVDVLGCVVSWTEGLKRRPFKGGKWEDVCGVLTTRVGFQ